jgi:diguanylate cyclase (GGDEF)-like protein
MPDLVELGLKRPPADAPMAPAAPADQEQALTEAVDRLLASLTTLAGSVLEAEPDVVSTFAARIEACRRTLTSGTSSRSMAEALDTAIRSIEHFLRSSRRYLAARESELTEMIRILHEAATLMAGQSTSFNAEVLATSDKLRAFAQLDDIRELKRQISTEVVTLRQAVEEKQRRDAESAAQLTERLAVLQTRLVQAEEEASIDPLTRVANRGAFDQVFTRMVAGARAAKTPLTLAMIDIDGFKRINDTHGHPVGDRVLLCAAMWLGKGLRQTDFLARYGGEEFAVVFKDARAAEIAARLTQMLADIAARSFEYDEDGVTKEVRFTVSAGLAELGGSEPGEDLLKRADEALYEAKRTGRNRVVFRKKSLLSGLLSR